MTFHFNLIKAKVFVLVLPAEVFFLSRLSLLWHREWNLINTFFSIATFGYKRWSNCLKSSPFPSNYFPVNIPIQIMKSVTSEVSVNNGLSKSRRKNNLPSFWLSAVAAGRNLVKDCKNKTKQIGGGFFSTCLGIKEFGFHWPTWLVQHFGKDTSMHKSGCGWHLNYQNKLSKTGFQHCPRWNSLILFCCGLESVKYMLVSTRLLWICTLFILNCCKICVAELLPIQQWG